MAPPPGRLTGLPPVTGPVPRVLVLGSFPSRLSLERREYFANPRNRFWPLVEALLGIPAALPYGERVRLLKERRIALWDVTRECEREGSDDATIRNEIVNDIPQFLRDHPSISVVILNGGGAARLFHGHFPDGDPGPAGSRGRPGGKGPLWTWFPGVLILALPSTSPANARFTLPGLVGRWSALRECAGE
jgi:TDG/mug DNA glycosylase family protein